MNLLLLGGMLLAGCGKRPPSDVPAPEDPPMSDPIHGRWWTLHTVTEVHGVLGEPIPPELPRILEFAPDGTFVERGLSMLQVGNWTREGNGVEVQFTGDSATLADEVRWTVVVDDETLRLGRPEAPGNRWWVGRRFEGGPALGRGPQPVPERLALDEATLRDDIDRFARSVREALLADGEWQDEVYGRILIRWSRPSPSDADPRPRPMLVLRVSTAFRRFGNEGGRLPTDTSARRVLHALAAAPDGTRLDLPGVGELSVEDSIGLFEFDRNGDVLLEVPPKRIVKLRASNAIREALQEQGPQVRQPRSSEPGSPP